MRYSRWRFSRRGGRRGLSFDNMNRRFNLLTVQYKNMCEDICDELRHLGPLQKDRELVNALKQSLRLLQECYREVNNN